MRIKLSDHFTYQKILLFTLPSIGTMLADAQSSLLIHPTQTLFPALLISVLMIAFNLCSNGLRDAFDPTQRGTE